MKKHNKLPEQELSDLTIDDVLNGNLESDGFFLEDELQDDALEEDLILGDESAMDEEDDVEYEIEFDDDDDLDEDDDDLDEDDVDLDDDDEDFEEEDLILDVDEDVEDLDDEEDPDEDLGG